jgi:hypothetical protein
MNALYGYMLTKTDLIFLLTTQSEPVFMHHSWELTSQHGSTKPQIMLHSKSPASASVGIILSDLSGTSAQRGT